MSHLLHGLFFLLKLVAVLPELVHYLPVQVHLIFQPQTSVLQFVCHPLLLLQNTQVRKQWLRKKNTHVFMIYVGKYATFEIRKPSSNQDEYRHTKRKKLVRVKLLMKFI